MIRVCVICEGQTEETFVRDVLAPALWESCLDVRARMIETSAGNKGGALTYPRVQRFLRNTLREDGGLIVTTMFDLYALDKGFPAFDIAQKVGELAEKLSILTAALHKDIIAIADCCPNRFIPFIQPHEFEALLFSDVDTLVSIEKEWASAAPRLKKARIEAESPEHINHHPNTKPAAYLERELKTPTYRKRLHGSKAAQKIGLAKIEEECAFFSGWLAQLRQLGAL